MLHHIEEAILDNHFGGIGTGLDMHMWYVRVE